MLFWSFVIIMVIGIAAIIIGKWMYDNTKYDTIWLEMIGWFVGICALIAILISCGLMVDAYGNADANVAKNIARYESLTYQLENDLYDNDNDLGKKELYDEIQKWNEDVVYYQNIQDNFWFGIYWPDVFDQFETIKYKAYE